MKLRDGHIKVAVQVLHGIKFDSVIRKLQGLVPLAQLAGNVRQTEVGRNKIRIYAGSLSTYADGFLGTVVRSHQLAQQDHSFRIARVQLNRFAQVIFGAFEFPVS